MGNLKNNIEIIPFDETLKEPIKTLNYEWLEKYFYIEDSDRKVLSNPIKEIIDKGGFIYYVKLNDTIVGTVSLLKKAKNVFEIAKMAVSEKAQGFGIGKLLIEHCLKTAQEKNIAKLILYSSTQLKTAIHLYKKYGFTEVALEKGTYKRADIKMEINFV